MERLAVDPDEAVRLAVSLRPELDETQRMSIDFAVNDFARGDVEWVRNGLTRYADRGRRPCPTGLMRAHPLEMQRGPRQDDPAPAAT
ncbi:hypothetical protein GCM10010431_81770 [Streptomyces kunmingensis]